MTVTFEPSPSRSTAPTSVASLEDRFEVTKEVGDGSFGSVAVARVRTAGSNIARRGTMVSRGNGLRSGCGKKKKNKEQRTHWG